MTRQQYLKQLTAWYDDVKFLGIAVAGQESEKSEKLVQIFVMPDVKARQGEIKRTIDPTYQNLGGPAEAYRGVLPISRHSVRGLPAPSPVPSRQHMPLGMPKPSVDQQALDNYDPREETVSRQYSLIEEQQQLQVLLAQESKTISASELLKQRGTNRCVLLGAPGSGKTTLISYFAVALATGEQGLGLDADYLPIVIRIRDWVRASEGGLLDYIRAFATEKLSVKDFPGGFFEHWLEAGKALILLDGLDEVANESRRDEVVNQIDCFLQHEQYQQNPAIITSRPAGYKQAYFRTEDFPHYDLQPFDVNKINQFVKNWYDSRFPDFSRV